MDKNKPRVFVVQEQPKFDYSDAERFGELHFLTNKEYNGFRNSARNRQATDDIAAGLEDFDPDTDFLLLTGSPVAMGFAFAVALTSAALQGHGRLNLLQWNNVGYNYKHIVFQR